LSLAVGRILAILLISTALGAGTAAWRGLPWTPDPEKWRQQQQAISSSAELRKKHGVDLATFRELIASGAIVIDARPADEFIKGHLLVNTYPPVLNCDAERAAQQIDRLKQLEGQQVVLYCTSLDCHLAEELILELQRLAFDPGTIDAMKVFPEGWEGILKAGLPTTTGPDTWTGYDELIDQADNATADPMDLADPADTGGEDAGESGTDGGGGR